MSTDSEPAGDERPGHAPVPLLLAVTLAALEGLALIVYAVGETVHLSADRLTMGVTVALFFAAYGVFLGVCARAVSRVESWARSPLVLTQLIELGVAWSFWGGTTTWVAVVLGVVALACLVGLLHPATTTALSAD